METGVLKRTESNAVIAPTEESTIVTIGEPAVVVKLIAGFVVSICGVILANAPPVMSQRSVDVPTAYLGLPLRSSQAWE